MAGGSPAGFRMPDVRCWMRRNLKLMRFDVRMTNTEYRRLNHIDPLLAGQELRGLVGLELVEQQGVARGTSYVLAVPTDTPQQRMPLTDEDRILAYIREHGSITNTECRDLLSVDDRRAYYLLKKLCDTGKLKPRRKGKWRRYVLS